MPQRRIQRKKQYPYRKTYRRRDTQLASPSGVPKSRVVSMRYCDIVPITSSVGAVGVYQFRANSIFDPNLSGVGHQPMGHDTMSTLYEKNIVLGCKITVQFSQPYTTTTEDIAVGLFIDADAGISYSSATGLVEARKGPYLTLTGNEQRSKFLSMNFSSKKFFNLTDMKDNYNSYGAYFGSNPNESAYITVWAQNLQGSTQTITATVVIDYIVAVSEPKDLLQS